MNNYQWLLQMDGADRKAWFDAEHAQESPTSDVMRNIGQVIEDTVKRGVYGDTAAQDEDSRERLEAEIEEWASIMDLEDQIDMIHGWLNRRAAILEREMVKFNRRYFDCVEQEKKIAELQEQVDKYKELNEYHALQYELASEDADRLQAQVDEMTADRVKLKSQICKLEDDLVRTSDERDNWKANCEDWKKDCERYREKFGKCIDYADAIHALMDDEGMA